MNQQAQTNKIKDYGKLADDIVQFLKDYCINSGQKGYCAGISGGVDSAVISTLCARTGLPCKFYSISIKSHAENNRNAEIQLSWLTKNYPNTSNWLYNLDKTYNSIIEDSQEFEYLSELSKANTKCRLRHVFLYAKANTNNLLVCLSGNYPEDKILGFATKGGDLNCGDISPISNLMKTEVWELAKYLGIPQQIIDAKPTDGLWDNPEHNDQAQIGANYPEIEEIIPYIGQSNIEQLTDRQNEVLTICNSFYNKNRHKMLPIPEFKVEHNKYQ